MERSEDRKADGSNSSTVFWATGRQNVLIFEGCSEAVCAPSAWKETLSLCSPQRLHLIKQWEKSGEYYTFFLSSASWLIVVLVQFWNSIPLFVRSRCDPLCSSHSFGKAGFRRRCLDVSSLCRGGHDSLHNMDFWKWKHMHGHIWPMMPPEVRYDGESHRDNRFLWVEARGGL